MLPNSLRLLESRVDLITLLLQEAQRFASELGEGLSGNGEALLAIEIPDSELVVVDDIIAIDIEVVKGGFHLSISHLISEVVEAVLELLSIDGTRLVGVILVKGGSYLAFFEHLDGVFGLGKKSLYRRDDVHQVGASGGLLIDGEGEELGINRNLIGDSLVDEAVGVRIYHIKKHEKCHTEEEDHFEGAVALRKLG